MATSGAVCQSTTRQKLKYTLRVTDWRRIVVGDALKLSSRNPRYYTDMFLLFPTLMFGMRFAVAVWNWPPASWDRREVLILGALLTLSIVLLRERVVVMIGCLAFVVYLTLRGTLVQPEKWPVGFGIIGVCLAGIFVLFWPNRFRTQVYGSNRPVHGLDMLGLLCGVAGLGLAILAANWLGRLPT